MGQKMTKKALKNLLWDTATKDEQFLLGDLGGTDILMDGMRNHIGKMKKATLLGYCEKAKERREKNPHWFQDEIEEIF